MSRPVHKIALVNLRRKAIASAGLGPAMLAFALAPAAAAADPAASPASAASTSTTPAGTSAPSPTATGTQPVVPAVAGRMRIALPGIGAREPFALTGERVVFEGAVAPYVAGQQVTVHIYRNGHIVRTSTVGVSAANHHRSGRFRVSYVSGKTGVVQAVAVHEPTTAMRLFAAGSDKVKVISPNLSTGTRGEAVRIMQRRLGALHYAVPQTGYFDEATADAVIAYRKMTGLARVDYTDAGMFRRLRRGDGAFHVRFPRDGRHMEANLQLQVLVEVEPHGRVANIYTMSSGKPSTPTVLGHFAVYRKEPGVNSELMYDSNYFISGYAIHGYPEVPTYAASHGCLRVPYLDAPALFAWIRIGTVVDVYN